MALADRQLGGSSARRKAEKIFLPTAETEPEEGFFDLESELTSERVAKIFSQLREYREKKKWGDLAEFASSVSSLLPLEGIPKDIFTDEVFDELIKGYDDNTLLPNRRYALSVFFSFYPHRVSEYNQRRIEYCEELKTRMDRDKKFKNWNDFYDLASEFLLFAPERKEEIPCDEETFRGTQESIIRNREMFLEKNQPESQHNAAAWRFFNLTAHIALVQPDKKSNLPLMDSLATQARKESLGYHAQEHRWLSFFRLLKNLAILYTDDLDIPSPGVLKFIKNPKIPITHSPLPQIVEY